ncbi:15844_t:CDS:2 [Dentiscutata erythropus]|uniref:15844_t:CDS:1 n=1 Tax=Dentiscutata erythropus TaxID=1348616 RepID=A0A9N9HLP6_9GLOM|nr:15844_t:CDS:2 [Dentiscutata erythropus]
MAAEKWQNVRKQNEVDIDKVIIQYLNMPLNLQDVFSQKKAIECKQLAEKELIELEFLYNISPNIQLHRELLVKMNKLRDEIKAQTQKINKLKRNAMYQSKCRDKKHKTLEEQNEVVRYDQPGRPSLLIQHPDLLYNIHDSVEYEAADIRLL